MFSNQKGFSPFHIFVYGTLRKGFDHPMAKILEERAIWIEETYIYGQLFDLGSYPGLVLSESKRVVGDLYLIKDIKLIDSLDDYEGPEYRKVKTKAYGKTTVYECIVYEFMDNLSNANRIPSGDYVKYLTK